MIGRLLRQPVTVLRREPGAEDVRGNAALAVESTYDALGYFEQTEAVEVQVDGDTITTTALLVLDASRQLGHLDLVAIDGEDWEVIGEPARKFNPRLGAVSQVEARLRRSLG